MYVYICLLKKKNRGIEDKKSSENCKMSKSGAPDTKAIIVLSLLMSETAFAQRSMR